MLKYRNKFRMSKISKILKNSIEKYMKGDVPTYIANDVIYRLDRGEKEITIPMVLGSYDKSLVSYLNEYHRYNNKAWTLDFLSIAIEFTHERIKQKIGKFKDVEIELLELSDTDKRVIVKVV